MRSLSKLMPISLVTVLFFSVPAVADRAPTPDERAKRSKPFPKGERLYKLGRNRVRRRVLGGR